MGTQVVSDVQLSMDAIGLLNLQSVVLVHAAANFHGMGHCQHMPPRGLASASASKGFHSVAVLCSQWCWCMQQQTFNGADVLSASLVHNCFGSL